jgi:Outer membrane protein beta-barrel family/Carboxypeptidase regulatory-like domain
MLQKLTLLFTLTLSALFATAQNSTITGNIKDTSSKTNVQNAVVALLSPKDSILKAFTRVKEDGSYSLKNVAPGKYIISVSHPTFGEYVDDIEIKSAQQSIGPIALTTKSKLLEAVIVKSGNPIKIKGDTTIYTADSFKVSANANVEELLKKLPGIQVDKNGQIKAMGQTVEKVLVDGEEFFGDDPGMAVKNLRADAVKEVQVFDKKSEQAEFTGIDDGKTKKTINLKLKEDKKKGYFGKIDLAGGLQNNIDHRYNDNILLSSFKGKRKITGFLLNGNTGQDGLSWQDEQKFGGENDNMVVDEESGFTYFSRGGGAGDDEPRVDVSNGFITNINAGLQYSNKWNDKTSLNFSPKYNSQRYNNVEEMDRRTGGDSVLNESTKTISTVNRSNVKLKAIYDVKLDSANTLKITAKTNFYETESNENTVGSTTGNKNIFLNSTNRTLITNSDKQALSLEAIFKHKFKKARRTLSLNADWSTLNTEGTRLQKSKNNVSGVQLDIDQTREFDKTTGKISSKLVYTEPLNKNYALELGYQLVFTNGKNNSTILDFNTTSQKYDTKIDSLSNNFDQNIIQNIPSAKINYAKKKFKFNLGTGIGFVNFKLKDLSLNKTTTRDFTNFFPTVNFTYSYKANHSLNIKYSGSTRQPTIAQLQPLRDNSNIFYQQIGNPDLKPTFTNSFNVSHNSYNFIKDMWTYQSVNFNVENNAISSNENVSSGGKTTSQAINVNGNYNMNLWAGLGFKVKKIDTRFNVNTNIGANKFVSFRNQLKNISNNTNVGLSLYVSKSKDKKYDLSMNIGTDYNSQKSTLGNIKTNYFTNRIGFDGTVYYKKVWSLNSNVEYFTRQKTENLGAISNGLWNAKLQRTFKKDEFTFYVLVRDILNQNRGIDRDFGFNTFTETRNERLKRYWMLGFAWNFKNKAATKK